MLKYKKQLVALAITAMLTAVTVVLSRFLSVNLWNMSIGVSFISLMLCGMICGPVWGGICAALADFIGATLFPFGAYFPGFTAVAFLTGIIFGIVGICGYKIKNQAVFIGVAAILLILKELVCSLIINSFWISLLYGGPYFAIFVSRVPLSIITVVFEIVFAIIANMLLLPPIRKVMERM